MGKNGKVFIKITNEDMYQIIQGLRESNTVATEAIKLANEHINTKLERIEGKIKINNWMAGASMAMSLSMMGFLIQHIIGTR
jgi:hypothetical protein